MPSSPESLACAPDEAIGPDASPYFRLPVHWNTITSICRIGLRREPSACGFISQWSGPAAVLLSHQNVQVLVSTVPALGGFHSTAERFFLPLCCCCSDSGLSPEISPPRSISFTIPLVATRRLRFTPCSQDPRRFHLGVRIRFDSCHEIAHLQLTRAKKSRWWRWGSHSLTGSLTHTH